MKLYLLSQSANTGYDTFDSAIVAAESEDDARTIHPSEAAEYVWNGNRGEWGRWSKPVFNEDAKIWHSGSLSGWASRPGQVQVTLIGVAVEDTKPGVVLASFNAG